REQACTDLWSKITHSQPHLAELNAERLADFAQAQVAKLLASDAWLSITSEQRSLRAELPIVHLSGRELVRGAIDLWVEKDGEGWVIDYKTTALARDAEDYRPQISAYCRAMRAIKPELKIRGFVLFTE